MSVIGILWRVDSAIAKCLDGNGPLAQTKKTFYDTCEPEFFQIPCKISSIRVSVDVLITSTILFACLFPGVVGWPETWNEESTKVWIFEWRVSINQITFSKYSLQFFFHCLSQHFLTTKQFWKHIFHEKILTS